MEPGFFAKGMAADGMTIFEDSCTTAHRDPQRIWLIQIAFYTDGAREVRPTIVLYVVDRSCSRPPEGVLGMTPPTQFTI